MNKKIAKTACRLVLVTVPDLKTGRQLADACLDRRLAACINLLPRVESHYLWRGARENSREILLMIKTTEFRLTELEQTVRQLHPYELPEFIVLPLDGGSTRYLDWIVGETAPTA